MEHLVESHMGGYYISDADPEIITEYCESCGDHDWILLSWEEGLMMETLTQYFSEAKHSLEYFERDKQEGITKEEAIENIVFEYSFENKNIIDNLCESNYISIEEAKLLLKECLKAQKKQIAMICKLYPKGKRKVLK